MDYFEKKDNKILHKLKELQIQQCCLHIEQQIGLWYQEKTATTTATTATPPPQHIPTSTETTTTTTPIPETTPTTAPSETPSTEQIAITELKEEPEITTATDIDLAVTTTITDTNTTDILATFADTDIDIAATTTATTASPSPSPSSSPPQTTSTNSTPSHLDDERTIGYFLSNIKHLEKFDSDATESTSSNDSYDELEGFSHEDILSRRRNFHSNTSHTHNNGNQDFSDLKKKAIWKWANERSRLASRWTWLQAQVADLEFRIRGQNDATIHARNFKTPPIPAFLPENSCSRTVPLSKDFRRRRLIKSSDSNKKLVKFSQVPCICSSLPQTVAPCLSCNGRYNYLKRIEGENLPLSERISLLDPCYHPVLSFPDDLTLGSQLSYLLKQETINRKPTKGRPGRKKGSTAEKLAEAAAAAAANGIPPKHSGKLYRGMVGRPPSQAILTSNKLRRKYRKHAHSNKRRASSVNESSGPPLVRRRRSEQSAYDIDNIVIPFSIAATTRVEVLEYKEIMTPSWRVWENGTCQTVDEENEDTSDEAYILRHSKGEKEEKKRFALKAEPENTTIISSRKPVKAEE